MGLMGLARSVYSFRPEGAVQLTALGNAQGKRQTNLFRPERAAQWVGDPPRSGNCPALTGRRILGSRFSWEAVLAFQAEESSVTTFMGKQLVFPCMSTAR